MSDESTVPEGPDRGPGSPQGASSAEPRWRRMAVPGVVALVALLVGLAAGRTTASAGLAADDPGPTRLVGIVPVGYAHTREGAAAAATNFVAAITRSFEQTQEERKKTIETLAVENRQIEAVAVAELLYGVISQQLGIDKGKPGVAVRPGILGHKVERYTEDKALVSLWGVVVLGQEGVVPPKGAWGTIRLELAWRGGDWKIGATPKLSPGPAPALLNLGGDPADAGELGRVGTFVYTPQGVPAQ